MPDRAYILYKVSKPAPGPEVITSFGVQLFQAKADMAWYVTVSYVKIEHTKEMKYV